MYVDDFKLAGKKQNIVPMWKVLNKQVDLGEPTSFFDHEILGCTQRQCEISKDIFDNYRIMFESRFSAGATEKLPCSENMCIFSWSYDMEGHAKKCVERYCELTYRTTQQLYKVSTPCIDDHHFKEEEVKSVGELSKVCSQIVLKCLYLARIGRPDHGIVVLCLFANRQMEWADSLLKKLRAISTASFIWWLRHELFSAITRFDCCRAKSYPGFSSYFALDPTLSCTCRKLCWSVLLRQVY